jgi:hypothetical protein
MGANHGKSGGGHFFSFSELGNFYLGNFQEYYWKIFLEIFRITEKDSVTFCCQAPQAKILSYI